MSDTPLQKATFAAGCFWGVEEFFRRVKGVKDVVVGYSGGNTEKPTYEQVTMGATGHAEAVQIVYAPSEASYDDLLQVFWANHDPTQKDRQGPDIGTQYRSVIFYHTPEQKAEAEQSVAKLKQSRKYDRPIVTEIIPAMPFYKAEDYHQRYLEKRGLRSCHI